jgi:hypothetical protein
MNPSYTIYNSRLYLIAITSYVANTLSEVQLCQSEGIEPTGSGLIDLRQSAL